MIQLTPKAATQIATMRASSPPEARLRLFIETGGCSGLQYGMSFDAPRSDDASFESEGIAIIVDPKSFAHLDGTTIDFDDGLHGKGFEIKNPNAHSTCGCGKSFN